MATLPADRTKLALAQANQVPSAVASAQRNIDTLTEIYDTVDLLNQKVDNHANSATLPHADGSVTTAKIANIAVTTPKIADLAVTAAKVANQTLTADKFVPGALTNDTQNALRITALEADIAYLTAPTRNILTVAKTGGQFETINDAIDFAKTYCTTTNRVTIYVGPGVYAEEIVLIPNPGIDIIGSGATVTSVQFASVYPNAPLYTMGAGYFADIGFISVSGGTSSYAFHFDSQIDPATGLIVIDRCLFLSYNNAGVGIGMGQDTTIQFNVCDIASLGFTAVYCHNLPSSNTSNQILEFSGCKITPYGFTKCLTVDDAAKIAGNSNSVMTISLANCQSSEPNISYRIGASTYLSYIPKTGSDILLGGNSKNTNILGCDADLSEFNTGGILPVMSNGLFTINLPNASRYDFTPLSAVDGSGTDVLSTVSFSATSDGYVVFTSTAPTVQGSTINFNVRATAK